MSTSSATLGARASLEGVADNRSTQRATIDRCGLSAGASDRWQKTTKARTESRGGTSLRSFDQGQHERLARRAQTGPILEPSVAVHQFPAVEK
jgi:hypothetical protein